MDNGCGWRSTNLTVLGVDGCQAMNKIFAADTQCCRSGLHIKTYKVHTHALPSSLSKLPPFSSH